MIVTNPFNVTAWTRAQIERVSKGWWVLLLTGVLSVVGGGIIVFTEWTAGDLALFIGALLLFRGIFTLLSVPVDGSARTWTVLTGVIEMAVGLAVWVWPDPTLLVVAAFIGWLLLFRGLMAITGSLAGRRVIPYWGLILAAGLVEVAVAFYLLSRPGLTLVATVLAIGLATMIYGVVEIVMAFEVKHLPDRFDELTSAFNGTGTPRRIEAQAVN